jgi:hypothetical protein
MIKAQRRSCSSGCMPAYSGRTVMKKYGPERKGRRNFETALHYDTVDMIPTE